MPIAQAPICRTSGIWMVRTCASSRQRLQRSTLPRPNAAKRRYGMPEFVSCVGRAGRRQWTGFVLSHALHVQQRVVQNWKVLRTEVKYVSLRQIVTDTNTDSARMHQQALMDFMVHLYTSPPVSADNLKYLLGPQVMDAWSTAELARVQRNFEVFGKSQEQEKARRVQGAGVE